MTQFDPPSLGELSPGELVSEIARTFRALREDMLPRLPSHRMRGIVERELRKAEATACRAVLMDPAAISLKLRSPFWVASLRSPPLRF